MECTNWNSIQSNLFNDTNVITWHSITFDQNSNQLFVHLYNGSIAVFNSTSSDWYLLQNQQFGYYFGATSCLFVSDPNTNNLYISGSFPQTTNGTIKNYFYLMEMNSTNYDFLQNGVDNGVNAMYLDTKSNSLFVGGAFQRAGTIQTANGIAKWSNIPNPTTATPIVTTISQFPTITTTALSTKTTNSPTSSTSSSLTTISSSLTKILTSSSSATISQNSIGSSSTTIIASILTTIGFILVKKEKKRINPRFCLIEYWFVIKINRY